MTAAAPVTRAASFPGERPVTPEVVREHNLTLSEFDRIVAMLGRTPTLTELGVFSALWSEHCSYKHSKPVLKRFLTTGPQVVQGPGENAGVLRLPNGWAVAFKIESHNHPSAVEPYQGAATGVGGILRDVFTMGARPVAVLNSLRFGPLSEPRNRYLFAGVVRGVGDYGNCIGVPTLGGEVGFADGYSGNPLVNAMCVGILRDVFTMGARPIAMLNSLRFGSLDSPRVRWLFAGVVKGVGDYGNCVGVPTVAGEVVFDPAYEGNPLVKIGRAHV